MSEKKRTVDQRLGDIEKSLKYNWVKNLVGVVAGTIVGGAFALTGHWMNIQAEDKRTDPLYNAFGDQAAQCYGKILTSLNNLEIQIAEGCRLAPAPANWVDKIEDELMQLTTVITSRPPLVDDEFVTAVGEFADSLSTRIDQMQPDDCSRTEAQLKELKATINKIAREGL